jgi:hypothetical protein
MAGKGGGGLGGSAGYAHLHSQSLGAAGGKTTNARGGEGRGRESSRLELTARLAYLHVIHSAILNPRP